MMIEQFDVVTFKDNNSTLVAVVDNCSEKYISVSSGNYSFYDLQLEQVTKIDTFACINADVLLPKITDWFFDQSDTKKNGYNLIIFSSKIKLLSAVCNIDVSDKDAYVKKKTKLIDFIFDYVKKHSTEVEESIVNSLGDIESRNDTDLIIVGCDNEKVCFEDKDNKIKKYVFIEDIVEQIGGVMHGGLPKNLMGSFTHNARMLVKVIAFIEDKNKKDGLRVF